MAHILRGSSIGSEQRFSTSQVEGSSPSHAAETYRGVVELADTSDLGSDAGRPRASASLATLTIAPKPTKQRREALDLDISVQVRTEPPFCQGNSNSGVPNC